MTDWLAICRAAVDDVRAVLEELPSRSEREPVVGDGKGGDDTTAIDAAVEQAVVARFDQAGGDFTLVSEELGVRAGGSTWVVLDPIDGSINAKRRLPFFSLSVAVAEGGTMDDVVFGYVYDFGSSEEWTAERGGGALLNGAPLPGEPPKDAIEILALEATRTELVARYAPRVRRSRPPAADLRLARDLALPPRRRAARRGLLAEAGALGGHRGRAAARP